MVFATIEMPPMARMNIGRRNFDLVLAIALATSCATGCAGDRAAGLRLRSFVAEDDEQRDARGDRCVLERET
jgi:hypothetical protein